MSRSVPDARTLSIGLDADGVAWLAREPAGHVVKRLAGTGRVVAALVKQAAGGTGAPVRTINAVVSDSVARHWVQAVPPGLKSLDELRLAASARCVQLFGGSQQSWRVSGDWSLRGPFVCAAIPADIWLGLEEAARALHSRLEVRSSLGTCLALGAHLLPDICIRAREWAYGASSPRASATSFITTASRTASCRSPLLPSR